MPRGSQICDAGIFGRTNEDERGAAAQGGTPMAGVCLPHCKADLPGRRVHRRAAGPAGTAKPGDTEKAHTLRSSTAPG